MSNKDIKKVKVRVTQEDIDNGEPGKTQTCPIALGLKRAGYYDCYVYPSHVNLTSYKNHMLGCSDLPRSAQRFIKRFDNELKVEPFNFYLDVPE